MFCCYIVFSEKLNRFYTGICQGSLEERIRKHNDHSHGEYRFTAKASDWKLYLKIDCESNSQSLKIEKHIKSMKSSQYIKNLILYPEIIEKLKQRFAGYLPSAAKAKTMAGREHQTPPKFFGAVGLMFPRHL